MPSQRPCHYERLFVTFGVIIRGADGVTGSHLVIEVEFSRVQELQ